MALLPDFAIPQNGIGLPSFVCCIAHNSATLARGLSIPLRYKISDLDVNILIELPSKIKIFGRSSTNSQFIQFNRSVGFRKTENLFDLAVFLISKNLHISKTGGGLSRYMSYAFKSTK